MLRWFAHPSKYVLKPKLHYMYFDLLWSTRSVEDASSCFCVDHKSDTLTITSHIKNVLLSRILKAIGKRQRREGF